MHSACAREFASGRRTLGVGRAVRALCLSVQPAACRPKHSTAARQHTSERALAAGQKRQDRLILLRISWQNASRHCAKLAAKLVQLATLPSGHSVLEKKKGTSYTSKSSEA